MKCDDKLREYGAVTLMQLMLEKYSERHNISIGEALNRFASSKLYDALFDYDGTELWKEGPDYFLSFFEEIMKRKQKI